jgi:hypothetical protein
VAASAEASGLPVTFAAEETNFIRTTFVPSVSGMSLAA